MNLTAFINKVIYEWKQMKLIYHGTVKTAWNVENEVFLQFVMPGPISQFKKREREKKKVKDF